MSDTPETDAAELIYDGIVASGYADVDVCRKLERELCEAREKYFAMRDLSNNATELAEKYKQERDTAKANLREAVSLISDRVKCDDFHHEKCDRHTIGEACPIVARFKAAVKRLEEVAYE